MFESLCLEIEAEWDPPAPPGRCLRSCGAPGVPATWGHLNATNHRTKMSGLQSLSGWSVPRPPAFLRGGGQLFEIPTQSLRWLLGFSLLKGFLSQMLALGPTEVLLRFLTALSLGVALAPNVTCPWSSDLSL